MREELAEIRSLAEALEPRLKLETDPLQVTLLLRNLLHHRIPFWPNYDTSAKYNFHNLAETFKKSVLDPRYGHMCGGRAIQYLAALKAFNLTARKVGMFIVVDQIQSLVSHAAIEVLIRGRWIAMDPQFNISLVDEQGEHIGCIEAAERGKCVLAEYDGFEAISEAFSIERYLSDGKMSLPDLLRYMATTPHWDGAQLRPGVKFPDAWDGVLRYQNGTTNRVFESYQKGVFQVLAAPCES